MSQNRDLSEPPVTPEIFALIGKGRLVKGIDMLTEHAKTFPPNLPLPGDTEMLAQAMAALYDACDAVAALSHAYIEDGDRSTLAVGAQARFLRMVGVLTVYQCREETLKSQAAEREVN